MDPTNSLFLQLADNSPAVDNGIDVGLPYHGKAPDLGAYECSSYDADIPFSVVQSSPPLETGKFEVTLIASETIVKVPTLLFVESDKTTTLVYLNGNLPGTTFTGIFKADETVAEGRGFFFLPAGSLVDVDGKTGNEIKQGVYFVVDNVAPSTPEIIQVELLDDPSE